MAIPKGKRPIVHTHPKNEFGENSREPSPQDINMLNEYWINNPNKKRPVSQIVIGENEVIKFHATGHEKLPLKTNKQIKEDKRRKRPRN